MSGDPGGPGELRRRLGGKTGRRLWRSLAELAREPDLMRLLRDEFPALAELDDARLDRRRILQLMGASLALGGVAGCGPTTTPDEAVPYVEAPPGVVPGLPRTFATAFTRDGYATGVLLVHQMGRPIKVEGNPEHPASLGATGVLAQASILDLYDPDRSPAILRQGRIAAAGAFTKALALRADDLARRGGEGLRLLGGAATSPTLAAQLAALR